MEAQNPNHVGFTKIKEKIISDAKKKAEKLLSEADVTSRQNTEAAKQEAEKLKKAERKKIELEVKLMIDKGIALARLNARKAFIKKREELINSIIDEALSNIRKSSKYASFLTKVFKENAKFLEGNITVYCDEADLKLVKESLKKAGLKADVNPSNVSNGSGGIIIEDSTGKRIEETIQARLERNRDEIRKAVAEFLKEYEEPSIKLEA